MTKHKLSEEYWDSRYKNDDTPWDLGQISSPIKGYLNHILKNHEGSKILIPGAGTGHEVMHAKQLGFDVYYLDFSKESVYQFLQVYPDFPRTKIVWQHLSAHLLTLCSITCLFSACIFCASVVLGSWDSVALWFCGYVTETFRGLPPNRNRYTDTNGSRS